MRNFAPYPLQPGFRGMREKNKKIDNAILSEIQIRTKGLRFSVLQAPFYGTFIWRNSRRFKLYILVMASLNRSWPCLPESKYCQISKDAFVEVLCTCTDRSIFFLKGIALGQSTELGSIKLEGFNWPEEVFTACGKTILNCFSVGILIFPFVLWSRFRPLTVLHKSLLLLSYRVKSS